MNNDNQNPNQNGYFINNNNINMQNSNVEQDAYYNNNDSYYSNDNYSNYSESTHEEKKKGNGTWWKILIIIIIIIIIILLLLKFCGSSLSRKSKDVRFEELRVRICNASTTYITNNPSILDSESVGRSAIIKFKTLSDANLIEAQVANPYYDGNLFKKGTVEKYYSSNTSVRLTMQGDGTPFCEIVDNSQDITAPELRLSGDSEISLAVGTAFEDPGYMATDDYDGDITDRVVRSGNVDISKAGTYTLTYAVQDSAGNVSSKTRVVKYEEFGDIDITLGSIVDGVTPMIQLKGSNPYCMVKDTQYIEPGATATDNVDGNITDRIVVTNKVSGNLMGAFRIVYKVEDSSGNQAIAYRAVIVTTECPEENESSNNEEWTYVNNAPTITLIGKSAVTINRGTEYIDLGAQAYDKEDGDLTSKIITDATGVNTNVAGVYKVIYRVTDSGGKTVNKTRTVTVKAPVDGNPSVRFTEDKSNVTVEVGKGNNSLIKAPKAVNENGVAVSVTMKIEDYVTKKAVSAIDWNKIGKYRVIYTAIHGNGTVKQTKSIVVTIANGEVKIGGKNPIEVPLRSTNCDLNEADLVKGGVTFTSTSTPIVTLDGNEDIACIVGEYGIEVTAKTPDGSEITAMIIVKVVDKGEQKVTPSNAPGKTIITGNSATPSNVHNTNEVWVGGAVTGIHVDFKSTPAAGTKIAFFEYSKNCNTADGQAPITSPNQGSMYWTEEGKNKVCIRAVTTDGVAGPWSNVVNLYIDLTGPKAEFTHTWADDMDDWHNTPTLTVTYKATDAGSGLDHFEYTYDDVKAKKADNITTHNEATGKLVVNENTEASRPQLYVYVRAVDKVGNKGEWTLKPAYANMDTVKPNAPVVDKIEGNETKIVKLTVAARDNKSTRTSGIGKFIYTLNGDEERSQLATALGYKIDRINGKRLDTRTACPKASSGGTAGVDYTAIEDTCIRESDYEATITLPVNNTGSDKVYDVRIWSVDRAGNKSDAYALEKVTVKTGKAATGVIMKNGDTTIPDGGSCAVDVIPQGKFKLTASPIPADADEKDVVWSISSTSIATIDPSGNVIAKTVGEATITAAIGNASTTCKLTVKKVISCPAGQYLPKDKAECVKCLANSYCEGIENVPVNPAEDKGIKACPKGYMSNEGASKCTAKTITVTYHKNDGSNTTATQIFTYGASNNKFGFETDGKAKWCNNSGSFGCWSRSGYNLLGWSKSSSATSKTWDVYSGVANDWINENYPKIDIYAVWSKAPVAYNAATGTTSAVVPSGNSSSSGGSSGGTGNQVWTVKDSSGKVVAKGATHDEAMKNAEKISDGVSYTLHNPTGTKVSNVSVTSGSGHLTVKENPINNNNSSTQVTNTKSYDSKGTTTSTTTKTGSTTTTTSTTVNKSTGTNVTQVVKSGSSYVVVNTTNNNTGKSTTTVTPKSSSSSKSSSAASAVKSYVGRTAASTGSKGSTSVYHSCFIAGTPVETDDGFKNIENIKVGDSVLSYNIENKKLEYNDVTAVYVHDDNTEDLYEVKVNGEIIKATGNHPFYVSMNYNHKFELYTPGKLGTKEDYYLPKFINQDTYCETASDCWTQLKYLKVGDYLLSADGNYYRIESITHYSINELVYNIEVANNHNYYVGNGGYLVHNKK